MKINFNTDRIIGLSAMLIGLLTLIIFTYQTSIIREQSRLSVTPRLVFNSLQVEKDSAISFSVEIINKGLGPAIIESINIVDGGKRYDLNFADYLNEAYPEAGKYGQLVTNTTLGKGATLSTDEKVLLFTFETNLLNAPQLYKYLNFEGNTLPFELESVYSSIYEESWRTNSKEKDHPTKL